MSRKSSLGYTLIELMIVLAIIAALIVGAFYLYPKVQASRAANAEAVILQSFQANMKSLFTMGDYQKVSNIVTAQAGMWNDQMIGATPSDTITNEWGGAVSVKPATAAGAVSAAGQTAHYFLVTYPGVPADVCQKLVPSLVGSFEKVSVGATIVQDLNAASPVRYDPSALAASCGGSSGSTTVSLALVSR
jgi:prepilin-type N-terminal cleavage/methylation domain-containing protein